MRVFFQRNPYCFLMAQKIKELKEESAHKIGKKFIAMGDWFGKTFSWFRKILSYIVII